MELAVKYIQHVQYMYLKGEEEKDFLTGNRNSSPFPPPLNAHVLSATNTYAIVALLWQQSYALTHPLILLLLTFLPQVR